MLIEWILTLGALGSLAVLAFIYAVIASTIGDWRPLSVYRALRG